MELPVQSILMFQSWPKVSINRNNTEIKLFSKYFSSVKKNEIRHHMSNNFDEEDPKSKSEADNFRTKGNSCFKIMEYNAALEMYNISLSRAPKNTKEYSLALANRSAVLFDLKKYEECLVDIDRVLELQYPKDLFHKVLLRKSKCFLELNKILKAKETLQEAQENFDNEKENMTDTQIALIEKNLNNLKDEIEERKDELTEKTEDKNNFEYPDPSLRDGENPNFLNASSAINFRYDSSIDRSVIATKDIKKGDILFIEDPYAYTALNRPENRFTVCSFCFEYSLNCVPCPNCTTNFYCSNKCQSSAWKLSHKWLCYNERHQIITDVRQKLGLSIILKASYEGFKTEIEDTSIYGNKDNNHPFMNLLLTHFATIPDFVLSYNIKAAVWIVMYLKCFTSYFHWLYDQPNHPGNTKEDMFNFVGGYLVRYLLQIGCNLDVIQEAHIHFENDRSASINYRGLGLGIYLSSALMNHSCLPNAGQSFQGRLKIVKALKDIKEGTEITLNYIGEGNEVETKERQSQLEKFMFQCTCLKCTKRNYDQIYKPYLCPRCRGKAYPHRGKAAAKCTACDLVFSRNKFTKELDAKIGKHLFLFEVTGDVSHKNALYGILKKTYHKDGSVYIAYHHACLKHYEKNGEIEKCLDALKSLIETTENVYGNSSKQYIITMVQIMYVIVNFTNILKKRGSKSYEKFLTATKEYLKKSVDSLQYFLCPRNISKFVDDINELLKSGEIQFNGEDDDDDDDFDLYDDSDCDYDSDFSDNMFESFAELCSFLRN